MSDTGRPCTHCCGCDLKVRMVRGCLSALGVVCAQLLRRLQMCFAICARLCVPGPRRARGGGEEGTCVRRLRRNRARMHTLSDKPLLRLTEDSLLKPYLLLSRQTGTG